MKTTIYLLILITACLKGYSQKWEKSADRTWQGPIQKHYKLDENCTLYSSTDTVSWSVSADGTWQDVEGKWYKINNQSLSYSTDGVTWKPSPDGRWVGSDGNTYRLEENCALNVMKGASLGKVDFLKEKEIYKRKINDRIQTLETRLEKLRSDLKNNPSYGSSIEKIEKTRGQLKLKLNELGDKAEVNWAQFKKDLDSFLNKESEQ